MFGWRGGRSLSTFAHIPIGAGSFVWEINKSAVDVLIQKHRHIWIYDVMYPDLLRYVQVNYLQSTITNRVDQSKVSG